MNWLIKRVWLACLFRVNSASQFGFRRRELTIETLEDRSLPSFGLSPTSLSFGSVPEGTPSLIQTTTLTNSDPNNVLLSITGSGPNPADFIPQDISSIGQPIGTSPVTIGVQFTPHTSGSESATITFNTSDGPLSLNVSGMGSGPVSLSPTSLNFGSVPEGTPSSIETTTLTNSDPNNKLLSITGSGPNPADFIPQDISSIGQPIGISPVTIGVQFTPHTSGSESATITFNTTDGPLSLNVSGTGSGPVSLSPTSLNFGSVPEGTPSSIETTTLTNSDPNNKLLSITGSGPNPADFIPQDISSIGQPIGTSPVTIGVQFTPHTSGSESATITFNTSDGPLSLNVSGSGSGPVSLSPTSLDFGSVPEGTPSSIETTTLTNLDPNNELLGISGGGADPADFFPVNFPTIGQPIGTSPVTIGVQFTPHTSGSESVTITFITTDGPLTLNVSGTGSTPVSLSPTSLDFGSVPQGTPSSIETTTLTNLDPNNELLGISGGGADPADFFPVDFPAIGQPIGTSPVTIAVQFMPGTAGSESATITFNTTDGPLALNVSGTGSTPVNLSPSSLDFGSVQVGSTSPTQSTTLTSLDPTNVLLGVVPGGSNPGDFVPLNLPEVGQPIGISPQPITFEFVPQTNGPESATVTFETSDGDITLDLEGTGLQAGLVSLDATALDFGAEPIGVPSYAPQSMALINQDPSNILRGITTGGPNASDFSLISGPSIGSTLAVGAQTIQFVFTPSVLGSESASYTFNTTDGSLTVQLSGSGTSSVFFASSNLQFGSDEVGEESFSPRTTTLVNEDPSNSILSTSFGGADAADFTLISGQTSGPLPVGPHDYLIEFTPSIIGSETATFSISTTDGNMTVNLTGTGTSPAYLTSSSLAFGSQYVGVESFSPRTTSIVSYDPNDSIISETFGGVDPADFSVISGPTAGPLVPGPQAFQFGFTPSIVGNESATFTIVTTQGILTVNLTGIGTNPDFLGWPTLSFGSDPVGEPSFSPRSTPITNYDPNDTILSTSFSGANAADFTLLAGPTAGPLTVGLQDYRFGFTPSIVGSESATFTIVTTDGTLTVNLSGTGTTDAYLNSPMLSFGSNPIGEQSFSPRSTSITNYDPNDTILSTSFSGANAADFFLLAGPTAGPLATGLQDYRFGFTPSIVGSETATFIIVTTDGTLMVNLSGTGTNPQFLASTTLAFGAQTVGIEEASPRSSALVNYDPNNSVISASISGTNAADFSLISGPTAGPITVGTQSYRFVFTPSLVGSESATFTIVTTDGTLTANLTGVGITRTTTAAVTLSHSAVSFGKVEEGTTSLPLDNSVWNFGSNIQLTGIVGSGADAADFQLVEPNPIPTGLLPVAQPVSANPTGTPSLILQFVFDPSTVGNESATFTAETTAGSFPITLSGTGTNPISLAHTSMSFGRVPEGVSVQPLTDGLWNFGQNVTIENVTSSSPLAADFPLLTSITSGEVLPAATPVFINPTGSSSLSLQFGFTPSTIGYESATYTVQTSAGNFNITLSGTGSNTVSLAHPSMSFGKVPEGVSVQPQTDGLWNFGQNVTIEGVTSSSPLSADFPLLSSITPGEVLPAATPVFINPTGNSSLSLQFGFTPSTVGYESATYTVQTSVGNFNITLSGTGTNPVSLVHTSMTFGKVPEGVSAQPLTDGMWNFGQNVTVLSVASSSPLAADFPLLTSITPGEVLPVATPVFINPTGSSSLPLQFGFTPSTLGNESATYTVETSAGNFNITLSGTGTNPVSLAHTSMTFGNIPEGAPAQPLTDGVWNFGQNVTVLGVTSSSPLAADFPLLTTITSGEVLPVATPVFINPTSGSSLQLQFGFIPSTVGTETATYTVETSVGNFKITLTGTGTSPISLSQSSIDFGTIAVGTQSVPLSAGLWNFGQNVQLQGISSSSPFASDFQVMSSAPIGQDLPVAVPVVFDPAGQPSLLLEFLFTPSTTGTETVTYIITTSAGTLTLTLTGTGV